MSNQKQNKNRKYGRSKTRCSIYRRNGIREINKARKLARHIKRFPNDKQARG